MEPKLMKIDRRAIQPFNEWWRLTNHCEPSPQAVAAFDAGFRAGLKCGIESAIETMRSASPSASPEGKS
jgi:hypothetical protein